MINQRFALWPVLVLGGALVGCATTHQGAQWQVFCDDERTVGRVSIARNPQPLEFYTSHVPANQMPGWKYEFMDTGIESVATREFGSMDGLRIVEEKFTLKDLYYTDMQMILQETEPGRFLPVYVQTYNQGIRTPSADIVSIKKAKFVVEAGMDYAGTGHFHNHYRIMMTRDHPPVVVGPHH